jgi:virginiamycin A acetyltransferase
VGIKVFIKDIVSGACICIVAPLGLIECAARSVVGRDVWFRAHAELLSLVPGKVGRYIRNAYYWITLKVCPMDCCFLFGSSFTHSDVVVGHRVYVGAYSMIGYATIGDDTIFGDHVHVLSGKHQHSFRDLDRSIQDQPQSFTRVLVGFNCWIGTNSVVMENIGNNCVVGAASVVTHPIGDNVIAVGNPARVVQDRLERERTKSNVERSS